MSDDFLSRWSRRKHAARANRPTEAAPVAPQAAPAAAAAAGAATAPSASPAEPAPLPSIESLTGDSDFSAFMRPEVDADLRRAALKKLLHDPRFNVMDGLDVYIDDYSKPDPLPAGWLERMTQVSRLGEYRAPEEQEDPALADAAEGAAPPEPLAESSPEALPAAPEPAPRSDTSDAPRHGAQSSEST